MPRGQYDRTKTKEQRAAEKKAAGKGAKTAAPAVSPQKAPKSFGSAVASKAAATESAVKSIEKAFPSRHEVAQVVSQVEKLVTSDYLLNAEINQVSAILTTLSSNRAMLETKNASLTEQLDTSIVSAIKHLDRLRQLLPHGIGQPELISREASKVDIKTTEQDRLAAEVEKRRGYTPNPIQMPGTAAPQPPAFLPLAAPPVNLS